MPKIPSVVVRALLTLALISVASFVTAAEPPPVPPKKPAIPMALARPSAGAVPETIVKDAMIWDVDGLKIINTGEVDQDGHVLLKVYTCQWSVKEKGKPPTFGCGWAQSPEAWILGHLHQMTVYTGRVFYITVHDRNDDGSVVALVTTRAAGNVQPVNAKAKPKQKNKNRPRVMTAQAR